MQAGACRAGGRPHPFGGLDLVAHQGEQRRDQQRRPGRTAPGHRLDDGADGGHQRVAGLDPDERFYFVHSYAARKWELESGISQDPKVTWANHGEDFVAAVENGPLWATQFHPELDVPDVIERLRAYRHCGYFHPDELDPLIELLLDCQVRTLETVTVLRMVAPAAYPEDSVEDALTAVMHRSLLGVQADVNVRPPADARPPRHLRHDAGLPGPFRP